MTNRDERVAEVSVRAYARVAHSVAARAVAVAYRGGVIEDMWLGSVDYTTPDDTFDFPSGLKCQYFSNDVPFAIFADFWRQARWEVENNPEVDVADFADLLDDLLRDAGGAADVYQEKVEELYVIADHLGFGPYVGRVWEGDWADELTQLWPAICEAAQCLINHEPVPHERVVDAIKRCDIS